MTPQQIKRALENIDTMLEKADQQSTRDYGTAQAIGALIIAVSNLRDIVNEMFMSKQVEGK